MGIIFNAGSYSYLNDAIYLLSVLGSYQRTIILDQCNSWGFSICDLGLQELIPHSAKK